MAVPLAVPLASAGIGLASQGINMYMANRDRRRAESALAAMGPRKPLEIPKEIMAAYQERLRRSKMNQGYSQAELNQMRNAQARQQATMFNRASGLGSSPMALQAMAANSAASGWSNVAAQNAVMNRQGRREDLNAADQLAGSIGRYGFASQQDVLGNYDRVQSQLGQSIAENKSYLSAANSGIGSMALTAATNPYLWNVQPKAILDPEVYG
jgi:hypothetical protein